MKLSTLVSNLCEIHWICLVLIFDISGRCDSGTKAPAKIEDGSDNAWWLDDAKAIIGKYFEYTLPANKQNLNFHITEAGTKHLPEWLYYNETANLLQGVPSAQDEGFVYIQVYAYPADTNMTKNSISWKDVFAVGVLFSKDGLHTFLGKTSSRDVKSANFRPFCEPTEATFFASLIFDVTFARTNAKEKVHIIHKFAEFISRSPFEITLSKKRSLAVEKLKGKTVLASGDGNAPRDTSIDDNSGVQVTWHLTCGYFSKAKDFTSVIDHNIQSGVLSKHLGYNFTGWDILGEPPVDKKFSHMRKKRQVNNFRTPRPTPSLSSALPTLVTGFTILTVISPAQSSTIFFTDSSMFRSSVTVLTPSTQMFFSSQSYFRSVLSASFAESSVLSAKTESFVSPSDLFSQSAASTMGTLPTESPSILETVYSTFQPSSSFTDISTFAITTSLSITDISSATFITTSPTFPQLSTFTSQLSESTVLYPFTLSLQTMSLSSTLISISPSTPTLFILSSSLIPPVFTSSNLQPSSSYYSFNIYSSQMTVPTPFLSTVFSTYFSSKVTTDTSNIPQKSSEFVSFSESLRDTHLPFTSINTDMSTFIPVSSQKFSLSTYIPLSYEVSSSTSFFRSETIILSSSIVMPSSQVLQTSAKKVTTELFSSTSLEPSTPTIIVSDLLSTREVITDTVSLPLPVSTPFTQSINLQSPSFSETLIQPFTSSLMTLSSESLFPSSVTFSPSQIFESRFSSFSGSFQTYSTSQLSTLSLSSLSINLSPSLIPTTGVSTTLPGVSTPLIGVSTLLSRVSTPVLRISTSMPEASTVLPAVSTTLPEVSSPAEYSTLVSFTMSSFPSKSVFSGFVSTSIQSEQSTLYSDIFTTVIPSPSMIQTTKQFVTETLSTLTFGSSQVTSTTSPVIQTSRFKSSISLSEISPIFGQSSVQASSVVASKFTFSPLSISALFSPPSIQTISTETFAFETTQTFHFSSLSLTETSPSLVISEVLTTSVVETVQPISSTLAPSFIQSGTVLPTVSQYMSSQVPTTTFQYTPSPSTTQISMVQPSFTSSTIPSSSTASYSSSFNFATSVVLSQILPESSSLTLQPSSMVPSVFLSSEQSLIDTSYFSFISDEVTSTLMITQPITTPFITTTGIYSSTPIVRSDTEMVTRLSSVLTPFYESTVLTETVPSVMQTFSVASTTTDFTSLQTTPHFQTTLFTSSILKSSQLYMSSLAPMSSLESSETSTSSTGLETSKFSSSSLQSSSKRTTILLSDSILLMSSQLLTTSDAPITDFLSSSRVQSSVGSDSMTRTRQVSSTIAPEVSLTTKPLISTILSTAVLPLSPSTFMLQSSSQLLSSVLSLTSVQTSLKIATRSVETASNLPSVTYSSEFIVPTLLSSIVQSTSLSGVESTVIPSLFIFSSVMASTIMPSPFVSVTSSILQSSVMSSLSRAISPGSMIGSDVPSSLDQSSSLPLITHSSSFDVMISSIIPSIFGTIQSSRFPSFMLSSTFGLMSSSYVTKLTPASSFDVMLSSTLPSPTPTSSSATKLSSGSPLPTPSSSFDMMLSSIPTPTPTSSVDMMLSSSLPLPTPSSSFDMMLSSSLPSPTPSSSVDMMLSSSLPLPTPSSSSTMKLSSSLPLPAPSSSFDVMLSSSLPTPTPTSFVDMILSSSLPSPTPTSSIDMMLSSSLQSPTPSSSFDVMLSSSLPSPTPSSSFGTVHSSSVLVHTSPPLPPTTQIPTTTDVTTTEGTTTDSPTTKPPPTTDQPNQAPLLINPIDHITMMTGNVLDYQIPFDTFHDPEDGDTRKLSLQLFDVDYKPLESSSWLQLDATNQILKGVAWEGKLLGRNHYLLAARDSEGLVSYDGLRIDVGDLPDLFTHEYVISLDEDINNFEGDGLRTFQFVDKLASFHGDVDKSAVNVRSVAAGSVVVTYSNNTISKLMCDLSAITTVFRRLAYSNKSLSEEFVKFMLPEFNVSTAELILIGLCNPTSSPDPPSPSLSPLSSGILLVTLLPAVILALIILLFTCVACIIYRRKRPGEVYLLSEEKPIFTKNRKPIFLKNEINARNPMQNKHPIVLPDDISPFLSLPETKLTQPSKRRPPPPDYGIPAYDMVDLEMDGLGDFLRRGAPPGYSPEPDLYFDNPKLSAPPDYKLPPPYLPTKTNERRNFQTSSF